MPLWRALSSSFNCFSPWYLITSNFSSFLPSTFLNLFKSPSFLSSFSNPLLKTLSYGEYSNLACSTTPGLYPKSSPVK